MVPDLRSVKGLGGLSVLLQALNLFAPLSAVAEAWSFTESLLPTPCVKLLFVTVVLVGVCAPVLQSLLPKYVVEVMTKLDAVAGLPESTFTFPSVKLVVAVPDTEPVAVAIYVATNQFGRVNCSVKAPLSSAVTSSDQLQLWPLSSFTKRWTASAACQPAPERVTVDPGV